MDPQDRKLRSKCLLSMRNGQFNKLKGLYLKGKVVTDIFLYIQYLNLKSDNRHPLLIRAVLVLLLFLQ